MVPYAEARAAQEGKKIDFSLTTNGTLLTEPMVDWLNEHRFGLTVSMDGPKAMHDANRITVGGNGTYDVVARKVRMLLSRYTARAVGVRVTLTRGVTDVLGIHNHLKMIWVLLKLGLAQRLRVLLHLSIWITMR